MTDIQTSIHGSRIGLTPKNGLVLQQPYTGQGVQVTSALHPGTPITKNMLFDDFLSAVLSTEKWGVFKGSDGGAVFPVIAVAKGGTAALATSGAGASSMAVSGCQLNGSLNFEADAGNLVFEAKVKLSSIAGVSLYVGLTDQTAALEMPVNSAGAGNTVTTNCTDGVGFLFDTTNTAQSFLLVGVANDVDAAVQVLANAPVANTYNILRIEITAAGIATFYIDGNAVGTAMTGAVTANIPLTPVIALFERAAAVKTATVDYIYAAQDRA